MVKMNARCARSPAPDNLDDEPIADTVKVLRAQQRKIMNHLSKQDQIMPELQLPISAGSNNSNGRIRAPPNVPINQMVSGTGNVASRESLD